jgi:rhamnogalacturonan endolyase
MEYRGRSLTAVKVTNGVYLSWRLLGTDNPETYFKIYRNNSLVKTTTAAEATNYSDTQGQTSSLYSLAAYLDSTLIDSAVQVSVWTAQHKTVQLNRPAGGTTPPNVEHDGTKNGTAINYPDGQSYTYTPNDCSTGDLDGDGEYEIIVKWDPSNSKDNSQTGITGNVYIDAYKLDGTQLWRIDLGKNIRAGAHYTQFLVYDFDGDGHAELVCRTAPGTVDGKGNNVLLGSDSPTADYRNLGLNTSGNSRCGFVLSGPEYVTLFDGLTGTELHSLPFKPARGTVSSWGDSYGNRVDRFLACVAYLDGVHPSAVMCRGYYAKAALAAYDVQNKQLVERWIYDSSTSASIAGQGNHNLSVADVDGDGKDEIIYGSSAIDDNGTRLYSTGLGHGDAMHLSDLDPDRAGLEVWEVHEETGSGRWNHELHDAATGAIIWHSTAYATDNGRGLAADIDASHRGFEMWSSAEAGTYDCKGVQISTKKPSQNFRIYWDGDLQDELLDGQSNPAITKWNGNGTTTLLTMSGTKTCNGTKATPSLSADILGDWREEVVVYVTNNTSQLRIYTTTTPTTNRLYTLMHDPVYRLGIAWQNAAYNQPPHLGFYLGDGVATAPVPNIYTPARVDIPDGNPKNSVDNSVKVFVGKNEVRIVSKDANIRSVNIYSMLGRLVYKNSNVNSRDFNASIPLEHNLLIVNVITDRGTSNFKVLRGNYQD